MGRARLWFHTGERRALGHIVRPFFEDHDFKSLRHADPAPFRCGESATDFSLFVTVLDSQAYGKHTDLAPATTTSLGSGHGLWRGRSIPDSTALVYTVSPLDETVRRHILTTFGKEFLCADQDASTSATGTRTSADQVAESGDFTSTNNQLPDGTTMPQKHYWLDPDPIELADGTWCVSAGAYIPLFDGDGRTIGATHGDFVYRAGDAADGCADAASLLRGDVVVIETLPTPGGRPVPGA